MLLGACGHPLRSIASRRPSGRGCARSFGCREKNFRRTMLPETTNYHANSLNRPGRANHFGLPEIMSSPCRKNISVYRKQKPEYVISHPVPLRGALRKVTSAGRGCGGRGWRSRPGRLMRMAKSCGPDTPDVGVKLAVSPASDGGNRAGLTGEITYKP